MPGCEGVGCRVVTGHSDRWGARVVGAAGWRSNREKGTLPMALPPALPHHPPMYSLLRPSPGACPGDQAHRRHSVLHTHAHTYRHTHARTTAHIAQRMWVLRGPRARAPGPPLALHRGPHSHPRTHAPHIHLHTHGQACTQAMEQGQGVSMASRRNRKAGCPPSQESKSCSKRRPIEGFGFRFSAYPNPSTGRQGHVRGRRCMRTGALGKKEIWAPPGPRSMRARPTSSETRSGRG